MNKPISISILGSCVCRDTLAFHKDAGFEISNNIEFISPVTAVYPANFIPDIEVLGLDNYDIVNYAKRMIVADFHKTVFDLLKKRPSQWLMIDFESVQKDLLKMFNAKYGTSNLLTQSLGIVKYKSQIKEQCEKIGGEIEELASETIDLEYLERCMQKYCEEISSLYSGDRIILVKLKFAERYISKDNKLKKFTSSKISRQARIDFCNEYLMNYFQNLHVIEFPLNAVADEKHKWGLSQFHYTMEYYDYVYKAVKLITLGTDKKVLKRRISEYYSECVNRISDRIANLGTKELLFQQNIRNFYEQLAYDEIHEQHFETWLEANREKKFAILKSNDSAGKYMISLLQSKGIEIVFTSAKRLLKELSAEEAKSCAAADVIVQCCVHSDITSEKYGTLESINIKSILTDA